MKSLREFWRSSRRDRDLCCEVQIAEATSEIFVQKKQNRSPTALNCFIGKRFNVYLNQA